MNPVHKIFFWVIGLVSPLTGNSQLYYEDEIKNGILIRGKVFGFVVIEDLWIANITAGAEFRLHPNFSLGLDFVHMNQIYEEEVHYDPQNWEVYNEYAQKNPRSCLLSDIRFYPLQDALFGSAFKPYLCAFGKFGKIRTFVQEGYPLTDDDVVNRHGKFNDLGLTIGSHWAWGEGRAGMDVNIGWCRRTQTEDVEYFATGGPNRFVADQEIITHRLAGRVNLFFYLFAKYK